METNSYILNKIFQGFQNCLCFYSSIKTEGVLLFLYIYIDIYLYIYEKLSPEYEQQVFFFSISHIVWKFQEDRTNNKENSKKFHTTSLISLN